MNPFAPISHIEDNISTRAHYYSTRRPTYGEVHTIPDMT